MHMFVIEHPIRLERAKLEAQLTVNDFGVVLLLVEARQ